MDYKVESFFSLADRPNHWWLLKSENGFDELAIPVADFTLGGAMYIKVFGDAWPDLDREYREIKVGRTIMGIGTGNETLFISVDRKFAMLNAFRT